MFYVTYYLDASLLLPLVPRLFSTTYLTWFNREATFAIIFKKNNLKTVSNTITCDFPIYNLNCFINIKIQPLNTNNT